MLKAASELQFEEAAALRDYLHTLQLQGLNVPPPRSDDLD